MSEVEEPRAGAMGGDEADGLVGEVVDVLVFFLRVRAPRCAEIEPVMRGGLGLEGVVVAVGIRREMPLAGRAGDIAGGAQPLGKSEGRAVELLAKQRFADRRPRMAIPGDDVPHSVARGVLAGEQGGARRRALGHHIGVGEARTLAGEAIEVGRGHLGAAVARESGPALIVSQNE